MPVVSAWVMPMGILGLLTMPFGFDAVFWRLMGEGIAWMVAVALWVSHLPGAVGRIAAFGVGPLLLGTAGLIVLCLLRSPLRWCGCIPLALASLWAVLTPRPDVLISPDAGTFAVRTGDGRLAIVRSGGDSFAARQWLAADADPRTPKDKALSEGIACDRVGCVGRLADGALIALARSPEAFAEDCIRAAVVASPRAAPPGCAAVVIDRSVLRRFGAVALTRSGHGFVITPSRPDGYDRPWVPRPRTHPRTARTMTAAEATPPPGDWRPQD